MLHLRERERKIVLLVASSLAVAIVCFGVLQSSGTFNNGALSIGGAFVGFAATFVLLTRAWGPPDSLEISAEKENLPLVMDEQLKLLDLRRAPPTDTPQRAPLSDYYRVRRTADNAHLTLNYATSGSIKFIGSTTHPQLATWTPQQGEHESVSGTNFPKKYELDVDLSSAREGDSVDVVTQVEYSDAFTKPEETLETHLDYPTGRLTMMVLMPDSVRCTAATGFAKAGRGRPKPRSPGPVVMRDGSILYWAIEHPEHMAGYLVRWEWQPRS